MPNTTTITADASAIGVSATNKSFPKLSEIAALRLLRAHEFSAAAKRVPIVGRVPCHEVQA